jgi:hypothetical protein
MLFCWTVSVTWLIGQSFSMHYLLKVGEEVTFPGLIDIKLIVEEINENRSTVRCKYYDEYLEKYIRLTLPSDALVPSKNAGKSKAAG